LGAWAERKSKNGGKVRDRREEGEGRGNGEQKLHQKAVRTYGGSDEFERVELDICSVYRESVGHD